MKVCWPVFFFCVICVILNVFLAFKRALHNHFSKALFPRWLDAGSLSFGFSLFPLVIYLFGESQDFPSMTLSRQHQTCSLLTPLGPAFFAVLDFFPRDSAGCFSIFFSCPGKTIIFFPNNTLCGFLADVFPLAPPRLFPGHPAGPTFLSFQLPCPPSRDRTGHPRPPPPPFSLSVEKDVIVRFFTTSLSATLEIKFSLPPRLPFQFFPPRPYCPLRCLL